MVKLLVFQFSPHFLHHIFLRFALSALEVPLRTAPFYCTYDYSLWYKAKVHTVKLFVMICFFPSLRRALKCVPVADVLNLYSSLTGGAVVWLRLRHATPLSTVGVHDARRFASVTWDPCHHYKARFQITFGTCRYTEKQVADTRQGVVI
jgi:hypothetical protein